MGHSKHMHACMQLLVLLPMASSNSRKRSVPLKDKVLIKKAEQHGITQASVAGVPASKSTAIQLLYMYV